MGTAFADLMFGLAGLSVVNGGIPKGKGVAENADFVEAEIGVQNQELSFTRVTKNVTADSRKFSEYIFKEGAAPGKAIVYKDLGYSAYDSDLLLKIYQEQAAAKYSSGNYILGKLDNYGRRIDIEIELHGIGAASGKTSYLQSGWMIKPDGTISLNTPFSGFTR